MTIRQLLQQLLDSYDDDDWLLGQFAIVMGLEMVGDDGRIIPAELPWVWSPPEQAPWITRGLLTGGLDALDAED